MRKKVDKGIVLLFIIVMILATIIFSSNRKNNFRILETQEKYNLANSYSNKLEYKQIL